MKSKKTRKKKDLVNYMFGCYSSYLHIFKATTLLNSVAKKKKKDQMSFQNNTFTAQPSRKIVRTFFSFPPLLLEK